MCGNTKTVRAGNLKSGASSSCGCLTKERTSEVKTTHGMSGTPTFNVWKGIRKRCLNENDSSYERYGARGIKVCEEWDEFSKFYEDMGERPGKGYSIERIDNEGNYSKENCKWATPVEQNRNKRNNLMLTHHQKTQCLSDWAKEIQMSMSTLHSRIFKYKWSIEKALTTPVRK
jgi:hypothetical protein